MSISLSRRLGYPSVAVWCIVAASMVGGTLPVHAFFVKDPVAYQLQRERAFDSYRAATKQAGSGNAINNGMFDSGLTSWTGTGSVSVVSAEAILGDAGASDPVLFQLVPLASGTYTIEFDFQSGLSSNVNIGTFPDTFFASLYFTDTPGSFDIGSGAFDASLGLLDLDYNGSFNSAGTISPSGKGGSWQHFSATFVNANGFVAATFELADLNGTDDDSQTLIDNVSIAVIPEPSTLLLAVSGVLLVLCRSRRVRT